MARQSEAQGNNAVWVSDSSMVFAVKIDGPGKIGPTAAASRKRSSGAGGISFASALTLDETSSAAAAGGMAPLSPLGSLLTIQEAPDAAAGRSKGVQRAEDLLAGLDELRRGLILGTISPAQLQLLSRNLESHRTTVDDPRLTDILGQIELRVAVELAKLGYAG